MAGGTFLKGKMRYFHDSPGAIAPDCAMHKIVYHSIELKSTSGNKKVVSFFTV